MRIHIDSSSLGRRIKLDIVILSLCEQELERSGVKKRGSVKWQSESVASVQDSMISFSTVQTKHWRHVIAIILM